SVPRNVNHINVRNPNVRACYECGSTNLVRSACPRLNRAQGPEENRPNQVAVNNGGQGRGNQGNQARGKAFMLGAEEACQDPNIVTCIEPSKLDFRYEIEIASSQLVKNDKPCLGQTTLLILVLAIFQPIDDQHQSLLECHPMFQSRILASCSFLDLYLGSLSSSSNSAYNFKAASSSNLI
nr:hypothetical protein [Tanacetum cinerariifolium]